MRQMQTFIGAGSVCLIELRETLHKNISNSELVWIVYR